MKASGTGSRSFSVFGSAAVFNPVLIQLAGICPVAAVSYNLFTSVLFSCVFTVMTMLCCLAASAFLKKLPRWLRVAVYFVLGLSVISVFLFVLDKTGTELDGRAGVYLPLLAVNSVTSVHCEQFAVKHSVGESFKDAVSVSLGFSAVFILLGSLREMLGNLSLAGVPLPVGIRLPGILMPFGSFIILGYLAMFLKWYINRFRPEYSDAAALPANPAVKPDVPRSSEAESGSDDTDGDGDDIFVEIWAPPYIDAGEAMNDLEAMSRRAREEAKEDRQKMNDFLSGIDEKINLLASAASAPDTPEDTEGTDNKE